MEDEGLQSLFMSKLWALEDKYPEFHKKVTLELCYWIKDRDKFWEELIGRIERNAPCVGMESLEYISYLFELPDAKEFISELNTKYRRSVRGRWNDRTKTYPIRMETFPG